MEKGMNSLLKWSVENSVPEGTDRDQAASNFNNIDAQTLAALMGGPSDADLMKESMAVICSPEASLDNKLVAFDNFEQLVESLDNANNMEPLGLWTPMVQQLHQEEAQLRMMAAWCLGTATQNNVKSQESMLAVGAFPKLAQLAVEDQDKTVRKKAIYALSSGVRNYQPALNETLKNLPSDITGSKSIEADDMDAIDRLMTTLRERSS